MKKDVSDKETERFYKLSYFVIPLPMILGLGFAAYVLITEDSRNLSYCAIAKSESAYQQQPLNQADFISHQAITLNLCKGKDSDIDGSDGYHAGRVRWFICSGTTCGPGWTALLSHH